MDYDVNELFADPTMVNVIEVAQQKIRSAHAGVIAVAMWKEADLHGQITPEAAIAICERTVSLLAHTPGQLCSPSDTPAEPRDVPPVSPETPWAEPCPITTGPLVDPSTRMEPPLSQVRLMIKLAVARWLHGETLKGYQETSIFPSVSVDVAYDHVISAWADVIAASGQASEIRAYMANNYALLNRHQLRKMLINTYQFMGTKKADPSGWEILITPDRKKLAACASAIIAETEQELK